MRLFAAGAAIFAAIVSSAGCGGSGSTRLMGVVTFPVPSGPGRLTASPAELASLQRLVPPRLPANPAQTCKFGATVVVTVPSGAVRYGPCERPGSIEAMRRALLRLAHERPHTGYVGRAWKAVLNDWYDGRMDEWHSCAAVRAAIRHLPVDDQVYGTVRIDLEAYAQAVC